MNGKQQHCDDIASDAALSWIARLRVGPVSEQDTLAFASWLADGKVNPAAMDRMQEMWDDLGSVKKLPFSAAYTRPAANQRNWLAASVAVAASFAFALLLWPQSSPDVAKLEYITAMGERQSYQLEDLSTLTLNTNSKVTVAYDGDIRHVDLLRGEAFFEVAKDPQRPFEVVVGSAKVTALGTAFNIYRRGEVAAITVTEGVVRVTELGTTGNRPPSTEVLHANQHLTATTEGFREVRAVDVSHHVAWTAGKLVADEMPLPELIVQLERYGDARIFIGDADIAALTISGVFELDQLNSVLNALELSHGLKVVELNDHTLQLLKASQ